MPPAFVLSQDQTLRFALARRLSASGKAQGIYARIFLTKHACNNTLLAPPPAHPFHPYNVNEQPHQVTPAGGGLISPRSKASQPGISPNFSCRNRHHPSDLQRPVADTRPATLPRRAISLGCWRPSKPTTGA